jgi:hypothetical protein
MQNAVLRARNEVTCTPSRCGIWQAETTQMHHWTGGTAPRAHGALREIRIGDVRSIRRLDPIHPVFLLEFLAPDAAGTTELVIKFDRGLDGGARFTATTELMQLVDPRAVAEVVSPSERLALRQMQETNPGQVTLEKMLTYKDYICVKMKVRRNFADLQIRGKPSSAKSTVAELMVQLPGNQEVWTRLGEIVAVDLFLGNADRIGASVDGRLGGAALHNLGNIFLKFDRHGKLKKALALDNYEGEGYATDLGKGYPKAWEQDFAPILKFGGVAREFSRSVVECVVGLGKEAEVELHFSDNEEDWFFRGLTSGMEKVKAFLVQRGGHLLPGIVSRAQYLKWM